MRGWRSKEAVVNARLRLAQKKPEVLCVNESFLDKATKDTALTVEGYSLAARRDRADNSAWGGVLVFARADVYNSVVLLESFDTAERVWLTLHLRPLRVGPPPQASARTSNVGNMGKFQGL